MTNNSVSFGSTRILYSGNNKPLSQYVSKVMSYPNRSFWNVKSFNSLEHAHKSIASGEIGVVLEKEGIRFVGSDNIDDKLIYRILKENFGKGKNSGISYKNDSVNIIA